MNNRDFTMEEIEEYVKCRDDIFYFIEKYVIITTPNGLSQFHPNQDQIDMITKIRDNRAVKNYSDRGSGMTTAVCAYILHYVLFNQYVSACIVSYKQLASNHTLDILRGMWSRLPQFLKVGLLKNNRSEFEFENGSNVRCFSSISPYRMRGYGINCLFLDDVSLYNQRDYHEIVAAIIPVISSSKEGKVIY